MVSPTDNTEIKEDQLNAEDSSTSDTDQVTEDSSDPSSSESNPSTFDVVMKAIKPEGEEEDESSSEEDESKESKDESKDSKDKSDDDFEDFTPEERKHLKKATTERFDKLKVLYRESKDKLQDVTTQLEQANVEAGHYRTFISYLDENRLSQQDANNLFHIGALVKNDPVRALETITPIYNELLRMTGNILPQDLYQQVQQGYITKERALELSRLRATGETERQIRSERETYQQNLDANRQHANQVSAVQSAIADWERKWASSDPDYAKKKDRVLDRVELLLVRAQRGGTLPDTVDAAIKLANQAKSEIESDLKQFRPRKQVTTVEGGSSTSNLPEPKTTADVIRRTINH